jgi:hypothetical protein
MTLVLPIAGQSAWDVTLNTALTYLDTSKATLVHTHAEADVTSLVSDLAVKVPTARTIATTAPLTGGGTLGADLTLAVSQFTSGAAGVVPASGGGSLNYLRADGTWSTPPAGSGTALMVNVKDYGAVGNGSTDDTAAIQAAIDAVAGSTTAGVSSGGGGVFIPAGTFQVSGLQIKHRVTLVGVGHGASILRQIAGSKVPVVRSADHVQNCSIRDLRIVGDPTSHGWAITSTTWNTPNLCIVTTSAHNIPQGMTVTVAGTGSAGNQGSFWHVVDRSWSATTTYAVGDVTTQGTHRYTVTVAGTSGGTIPTFPTGTGATVADGGVTWKECGLAANSVIVQPDTANSPASTGAVGTVSWAHGILLQSHLNNSGTLDEQNDPRHDIIGVMVRYAGADGFVIQDRGANSTVGCWSYDSNGHGFNCGTDNQLVNCDSGTSGYDGFYVSGGECRITGSKAWYSGQVQSTGGLGNGFHITNFAGGQYTGLSAQDNGRSGYFFDSCGRQIGTALEADSNARLTAQAAPAFDFRNAYTCSIQGMAWDRNQTPGSRQKYAVDFSNGSSGNSIDIVFEDGSVSGALAIKTPGNISGNRVRVNQMTGGIRLGQTPSAGSYTPPKYDSLIVMSALTAIVTINAPVESIPGQEMTLVIPQDATGGRTVSFNAIYKTTGAIVTTLSTTTRIRFLFDGTNWVEIARTLI